MDILFGELSLFFAKASFAVFLAKVLFFLIIVFAVIGIISTIKFFAGRKSRKETPGEYWMRTGKTKK